MVNWIKKHNTQQYEKTSNHPFLLVLIWTPLNAQWTVQTVPNPMETKSTFVANPDNILTQDEANLLDSIVKGIEQETTAEIAIVMLQSIGEEVPKTFATGLFNRWGVGTKESDNGLLVLFVMDQRRIEFETGYGMEQVLTDAMCYKIQQDNMVPRFKEGNYGKGILDGMLAVANILTEKYFYVNETGKSISTTTVSKQYTSKNTASTTNDYSNDYSNDYTSNYDYDYYNNYSEYDTPLGFYIRAVLFAMLLYLILYIITIFQKDYFHRYLTLRIFKLYIWFIFFPIPFVLLYIYTKRLLEKWRNTPRISAKTGKLMHKLSEDDDNKFLEKGQVTEEQVKSVDYDVWVTDEEDDVLILAYKRWFSKYSGCPKCKYKTYYKVYDKVIRSATYSSSGEGERMHKCANCGHSKITRYTIPKKTKSSSSSSSSYRSSWGGSSSYGGSSGGSSFGGGSSGGGGAGSSW
ncbi:MAG: hypothetical protein HC831_09845 [Chloroflexia bacterium]|nr:hypothetical protein [Chloroflexia bacterium]